MRAYLSILFIALVAAVAVNPTAIGAEPPPTVKLTFDKSFYGRGESFTATGTVTSASGQTLRYTRLTLSVFPALKRGSALTKAFDRPAAPMIRQNWYKPIGPGTTVAVLSRDLSALKLDEGVYPAEFTLTLADRQTVSDRTYLVVMEPKDRQMPVAIVWNLHQPERRLPDGAFSDNTLAGLVANKPDNQGLLTRQLAILSEQPTLKANLAASPLLLEQLSSMAAGYAWREGASVQTARRDSEPAGAAKSWLEALKNTVNGGQAEILTSPYGQSPLPTLAALGWQADALRQLASSHAVNKKALALENQLPGLYLPGLLLDKHSAQWLIQAKVKYAVARVSDSAGDLTAVPLPPVAFGTGRRRLTIFQSDQEITDWLRAAPPEKAGAELTALLAQRFLAGNPDDIVTIASDEAHALPSAELLQETYKVLAQTPWVKTVSLSSALDKPTVAAELKAGKAARVADRTYERKLRGSRRALSDFAAAVAPTNELRQSLERQFYVAESIDYLLGHDAQIPAIGKINADNVRRTVSREFAKIELATPSKITFSTKAGKIPVAIMNRAGYPLKVRLRLAGKDFVFSDDKQEQVTLSPKENLISYDITAGFVGVSKLNVTILIGDRTIDSRGVEVRVSNLLRYLVVTATTLSIIGMGAVLLLRGKRR